ncbi:Dimeric alpha-beta barrel [Niveomyces insectorum RCEF 264]|uniref:Dimeric alpha-beta barrel n=1 Tax=Niveomyces insectorum RCEF 264 TaxID=1081102 RepID=A0A167QGT7_9HYPO|nr:Dimeric alpha-beta barrel [Niveomyces insectorum RCEF 264]
MPKLVFAVLPTVGGKLREEYVAKMAAVSEYAKTSEPGVLTYAVCLPRDEADQKTVYAIEIYQDQAALDAHMQTANVKDLIAWMGANPVLAKAPTVTELDVIEDLGLLVRNDKLAAVTDPYVVVGEVTYKNGELVQQSLPHWAKVVETNKTSEPGTLVYALSRGAAEPSKLYTLEAYESKDYLWDVHAKSAAVQANVATTKEWRDNLTLHVVRKAHGYLARAKL